MRWNIERRSEIRAPTCRSSQRTRWVSLTSPQPTDGDGTIQREHIPFDVVNQSKSCSFKIQILANPPTLHPCKYWSDANTIGRTQKWIKLWTFSPPPRSPILLLRINDFYKFPVSTSHHVKHASFKTRCSYQIRSARRARFGHVLCRKKNHVIIILFILLPGQPIAECSFNDNKINRWTFILIRP